MESAAHPLANHPDIRLAYLPAEIIGDLVADVAAWVLRGGEVEWEGFAGSLAQERMVNLAVAHGEWVALIAAEQLLRWSGDDLSERYARATRFARRLCRTLPDILRPLATTRRMDLAPARHQRIMVAMMRKWREASGALVEVIDCFIAARKRVLESSARPPASSKPPTKRELLDAQIRTLLAKNPDCLLWSAAEWGRRLVASPSTIHALPVWSEIQQTRERERLQRARLHREC